jgi:hypothetical protein
MATEFSEGCIYTLVHADLLDDAARQGGPTEFREYKAWVTGRQL